MKKTALLFVALVVLTTLLVSCFDPSGSVETSETNQKNESTDQAIGQTIDINELAEELVSQISFSEPLMQNTSYLVSMFPQLTDVILSCVAYVPAGITPEEIFIFETTDTKKVLNELDSYVTRQISDYSSYAPKQVAKLENPVKYVNGTTVIYVVSEDNERALSYIDGLFKN